MIRTMNALLFFMISFISTSSFSSTTHALLATGTAIEAELPPNEPQTFVNFLLWKVKGSCEVISETPRNPLSFKMLNSKGSINGVEFPQGESMYLVADAGQRFELTADARAKIEILNLGAATVKLKCSA